MSNSDNTQNQSESQVNLFSALDKYSYRIPIEKSDDINLGGAVHHQRWTKADLGLENTRMKQPSRTAMLAAMASGSPQPSPTVDLFAQISEIDLYCMLVLFPPFIGFDALQQAPMIVGRCPWQGLEDYRPEELPRMQDDDDTRSLQLAMQAKGWHSVTEEKCARVLKMLAKDNTFDPLQMYFKSLKWDGVPRIDDFLINSCGAEPGERTQIAGRILLMQGVLRALYPGPSCKADMVVVLSGAGGLRKSGFCAALCPSASWFSDSIPHDLTSKDAQQHVGTKFLAELPEMFSLKKTDIKGFKSFISLTTDIFRAAYDKLPRHIPRRCIFVGTTNDMRMLADETGERRLIPIVVTKRIDLDWIIRNRDQLWAEAVVMLEERRKKGMFVIGIKEELALKSGISRHRVTTAYEDVIEDWGDIVGDRFFRIRDFFEFALGRLQPDISHGQGFRSTRDVVDFNREAKALGYALRMGGYESTLVTFTRETRTREGCPPRNVSMWRRIRYVDDNGHEFEDTNVLRKHVNWPEGVFHASSLLPNLDSHVLPDMQPSAAVEQPSKS